MVKRGLLQFLYCIFGINKTFTSKYFSHSDFVGEHIHQFVIQEIH